MQRILGYFSFFFYLNYRRGVLPSKDLKMCYQRQGAANILPRWGNILDESDGDNEPICTDWREIQKMPRGK